MNPVDGFVRLASLRNDLQVLNTGPDRCPHRLRVKQAIEWAAVPSTLGSFGEQIVILGKPYALKATYLCAEYRSGVRFLRAEV